ncbi:hypothetical protein ABPG75_000222 [Micractinium tetrahymenae]
MGAYLSSPVRDKETEEGENDSYRFGISAMQGWRTDMEDAHAAVLDLPDGGTKSALFAVLDGHGGAEVARFVANHLAQELVSTEGYQANDMERALKQAYLRMDELLVKEEHREELKSLRAKETEEEGDGGPMVINGASLPESLLEALGMPSGGGFQIKLVRSGPGARGIAIDDIEEGEGEDRSGATIVEVVEGDPEEEEEAAQTAAAAGGEAGAAAEEGAAEDAAAGGAAAAAAAAAERNSKRKREDKAMEIDAAGAAGEPSGGGDAQQQQKQQQEEGAEAAEDVEEAVEGMVTPEKGDDNYLGPSAGCTAVCAVVRGGELFVANAGDSRCVLSRAGRAVAMTQDHKPMDSEEYARIMKAGGFVADGRVNGSLNLSRALGDLEYKQTKELGPEEQMVTAMPEIRRETLQPGDEFLVLACDGIWDVLTNQEAVDFVRERLAAGKPPREVAEEMCDHCLAPDTGGCGKGCDNMSVVVVQLKDFVAK